MYLLKYGCINNGDILLRNFNDLKREINTLNRIRFKKSIKRKIYVFEIQNFLLFCVLLHNTRDN